MLVSSIFLQIFTNVWPLYSTVNLYRARQLLRLTEPMGPGAGWHLRIKINGMKKIGTGGNTDIRQASIPS
jgi:hypothetical protein